MTLGSHLKRSLILLAKAVITFAAAWFVFRHYDGMRLLRLAAHADVVWLSLAAVLGFGQFLVMAWRWQLLHRLLTGMNLPIALAAAGLGRGMLYGQLLPAIVGMDAIRIATIANETGLQPAIRSVISDRVVGLWTLVVLAGATLPLSVLLIGYGLAATGIIVVSSCGLAATCILLCWPNLLQPIPIVGTFIRQIALDMRLVLRSSLGAGVSAISILSHLLGVLLFATFARSVGSDISIIISLVVIPQVMLISSIPISLGGWGVREAIIASAYAYIGADPAAGATASILFGLSTPLIGAIGELINIFLRAKSIHLHAHPGGSKQLSNFTGK